MHWLICDCGLPQTPFAQVVPVVQPFLSSHAAPLFAACPPWQPPFRQTSPMVQLLPSSQAVPLGATVVVQDFNASLHTPVWQLLLGGAQGLGSAVHLAAWQ